MRRLTLLVAKFMIAKYNRSGRLRCREQHLRLGELILEVDLWVLHTDSYQSDLPQILCVDRCLIDLAVPTRIGGALIVMMRPLTPMYPGVIFLLTVFNVDKVSLAEFLIVEAVNEVMYYKLEGLLCVEKSDSLNIYHVFHSKLLLLKRVSSRHVKNEGILSSLILLLPLLHLRGGIVIERDLLVLTVADHDYGLYRVIVCKDEIVENSLMPAEIEIVVMMMMSAHSSSSQRIDLVRVQGGYHDVLVEH